MEKKVIFIQVPNDMDVDEVDGLLHSLKETKLNYTFVIVSDDYKAMDADEINEFLNHLLETTTA